MKFNNIKAVVFDFDGVFTDNTVYVFENGMEAVKCNRSDGIGLEMLRKKKIPIIIISSEANTVVKVRAEKLNIPVVNGVKNKLIELKKFVFKHNFDLVDIAFLGNDINDKLCMRNVGFPISVNDAVEEIKLISKHVLNKKGGEGAVRELCELISDSYDKNK